MPYHYQLHVVDPVCVNFVNRFEPVPAWSIASLIDPYWDVIGRGLEQQHFAFLPGNVGCCDTVPLISALE